MIKQNLKYLILAFSFIPLTQSMAQRSIEDAFNRKHEFELDRFQFIRIKHESPEIPYAYAMQFFRNGEAPWAHDFPTAEYNMYDILAQRTAIKVTGDPRVLTFDDDEIFDYPVLYICEIGYWKLSDERAQRLGEYLKRGGFMIVDDFRMLHELDSFREQMRKAVPEFTESPLKADHAIFNCYFEFPTLPLETPYNRFGPPVFYGWFDEDGRLAAIVNYNNDIGDGWEIARVTTRRFSASSFMLGINYFIYSLTH